MDLKTYFTSADSRDIMDIAYSVFPDIPGNSAIHFLEAVRQGFHGMKADMRLSRDGEVILCHDAGYTFDAAGNITRFSREDFTAIHDLTAEEISRLRFAVPFNGVSWKPCTLGEMLHICRENDRIAYLTVRDEPWRPEVAEHMVELLHRFDMTGRTIINLYPPPQFEAVKLIDGLCPGLQYCHTLKPDTPLTAGLIDDSAAAGCRIICVCGITDGGFDPSLVRYAADAGVRIWCWGLKTQEELKDAVARGTSGFQMYMPEGTPGMLAQLFPGQVSI